MYEIIQELEADNSRLAKEAILKREADANNIEFFNGVRLALDNYITFGVKKVPTFKGPDGQGLPWVAFQELCELYYILDSSQVTKLNRRSNLLLVQVLRHSGMIGIVVSLLRTCDAVFQKRL
jgi:hypothetical protein